MLTKPQVAHDRLWLDFAEKLEAELAAETARANRERRAAEETHSQHVEAWRLTTKFEAERDALAAQVAKLSYNLASLRLELAACEHTRLKDNQFLLDRAERLSFALNFLRLPLGIDPAVSNDDLEGLLKAFNEKLKIWDSRLQLEQASNDSRTLLGFCQGILEVIETCPTSYNRDGVTEALKRIREHLK